ncbi:MAG: ATP synthase F0 subunit B [Myxococcota bacterium]
MTRHLATLLAVLLAAAPAAAAEGAGLLWPTVNFLILFTVLFVLVRKPAVQFFTDRREDIRKQLEEAAALKKEAEERHAQWQRKLTELDQELASIRTTAEERVETERQHLLADAKAAAERIRKDAATAVDQELRRARGSLRQEASELAVQLASGMLRENVTGEDRDRLVDEFITRIERAPEASS